MPTRILIVFVHPRKDSLCAALADAYKQGALQSGAEVHEMVLADEEFDLNVTHHSPRQQPMENSVQEAQSLITWGKHHNNVYPAGGGAGPARRGGGRGRGGGPGGAGGGAEQPGQY